MNTTLLVQLVLGGFGVSGIVGAGVALFKLRPDVNSAAVVQSEGTMRNMQILIDQTAKDRDYWAKRAEAAEADVTRLEAEVRRLRDGVT